MKQYIYPQNLKATANLWLWSLRDFAILCVALLLSILIITQLHFIPPLALTAAYAFLYIRLGDVTMLDYLRYAANFLIFGQQEFDWAA